MFSPADEVAKAWKIPAKYAGYATPIPVRLLQNVQVVFDELKSGGACGSSKPHSVKRGLALRQQLAVYQRTHPKPTRPVRNSRAVHPVASDAVRLEP